MKTLSDKKRKGVQVFSIDDDQCIWMKAGVINFKRCDNAYDCLSCPFDKAMSRTVEKKPEEVGSWRQAMRSKAYEEKECRHMLTGRTQYHFCSNSYRCNICEFDQYLDEADLATATGSVHINKVSGFDVADSYYYHRGHSWARVEHGGFVRIGIDDFTLRLLGSPTDIRLPKLGSPVEQTEVAWSLRREGNEAPMLSPMNGIVVATNHKVSRAPQLAQKDPYGNGWLMVVEPLSLKQNLRNLLFEQQAASWVRAEAQRLEIMVTEVYGMPLAATGGEIIDDIVGSLNMDWDDLVHSFLLT